MPKGMKPLGSVKLRVLTFGAPAAHERVIKYCKLRPLNPKNQTPIAVGSIPDGRAQQVWS
jgi:hypothetical protein